MSLMRIEPTSLKGVIKIQPAKALSHRSVICAALAEGTSIIHNLGTSDDILATISGLEALGLARFSHQNGDIEVFGGQNCQEKMADLDCRDS